MTGAVDDALVGLVEKAARALHDTMCCDGDYPCQEPVDHPYTTLAQQALVAVLPDMRRAVGKSLLALADEMENPNAERGTMPGVRMQVRRYWAGRIRAAVEQTDDEEPCAEFGPHRRGEHARIARAAAHPRSP